VPEAPKPDVAPDAIVPTLRELLLRQALGKKSCANVDLLAREAARYRVEMVVEFHVIIDVDPRGLPFARRILPFMPPLVAVMQQGNGQG
jgi:hypothetical protein